jgi:hypothetical protein
MRYGAISLADSGSITFETNGALTSLGTSSTLTLTSGSGGTVSAGGILKLQSGSGGSTSGKGGDLQLFAGPAAGSTGGAGGDVFLLAGAAAGSAGGVGGSISMTAGAALIGNQAGGGVTLTGGAPSGTGTSGAVTLIGANNTGNVGGNVVFRGGRGNAALNDGVVQVDRTSIDNRASRLRFVGDNAGTVDLKAGSSVTSYAMTWPTAQGAASSVLLNNGSGTLSWSTNYLTDAQHLTLDQLVHSVVETSFEEYTYASGQVSTIIVWTSPAKTLRIRDETFSYSGVQVSQIVTRQYDSAGVVVETMTEVFAYSGSTVSDITRTFV